MIIMIERQIPIIGKEKRSKEHTVSKTHPLADSEIEAAKTDQRSPATETEK